MKILIKNIKGLVQVRDQHSPFIAGESMKELPVLEDAWLAIEDGKIADYGSMAAWPGISDWSNLEIIDADGKYVFPSWVDSHTHLVYAGTRESEFSDRLDGLSYEEIAAKGGGILNSAIKLQSAKEDELLSSAQKRLDSVIQMGTGAIEIKSGYGLTAEAELKILRVIQQLRSQNDIPIKSTFLGAHAFPKAFKKNPDEYIRLIIDEMIPAIAQEGLAEYIDVFCESNYFSVDQSRQILNAGIAAGLRPKIHVNQFTSIGGIQLGVELNALSVDHLEVMDEADFTSLKKSQTMPTLLPSCSLFIEIPYGPARKMIDKGLPIALATDYNPGSSPNGNMNLVNSLASIKMKMTAEETINASTINGAYAMGLEKEIGSITRGKWANIFFTKDIPSYGYLNYSFGENCIDRVMIKGKFID
ncbi:MAG: imidazolonepropionase [Bacteroidota bacterium]